MSFPAYRDFEDDTRLSKNAWTLYRWCVRNWHSSTPRSRKAAAIAIETGIARELVYPALNELRERGFLREHPRGEGNSRWFTVNWEVELPKSNAA